MALTDTKKAKEFMAGAPDIKLKGDLRPMKMASDPDPMDERNNALENLADQYYGKPLRDLSPREIELLEEALDEMTMKSVPSMKMASMDENEREFMRLVEEFMERGFNQQEAIEEARETLEKKSMAYGGRAQYGLGSLVKSVKKAVKGVARGVKDVVKSPLGLAAIGLGINQFGIPFTGGKGAGFLGNIFSKGGTLSSLLNLSGKGTAMDALKVGGAGAVITGLLASMEKQEGESDMDYAQRRAQVKDQLDVQFRRLYPQGGNESNEDYNIRISALVEGADDQTVPVGNMAYGGRVMRAMGDSASDNAVQAAGIEGLPLRENSKGVKEIDLRNTGGFIPPVGVKEKADDIPAMLSNNEFVFTADAVRAAGGGSVNKGAQRMYDLMKNLESKVV